MKLLWRILMFFSIACLERLREIKPSAMMAGQAEF
jgi:hypothetical protein